MMVESSVAQCRRDFLWNRMLIGFYDDSEGRRKHRSEPTEEARDPVGSSRQFSSYLVLSCLGACQSSIANRVVNQHFKQTKFSDFSA